MRVLHLADTPLSGAPFRLMQVQRCGGIDARLISHRNFYTSSSPVFYEADILLQNGFDAQKNSPPPFKKEDIETLFRNADVFHFHNYYLNQRIFKLFPEFKRYLKGKKVIFQVHSPRNSIDGVEDAINDKSIHNFLVVAQYQTRHFPKFTVVPNAVPIHDSLHTPINSNNSLRRVCYSPSNTVLRDWNNKGFSETVSAISRCKNKFDFLSITHKPHKECLRLKQTSDIAIDEIITGSYHMCTLEALSMGQIAISNIDDLCQEAVMKVTGGTPLPVRKANAKDLHTVLDSLLEMSKEQLDYEKRMSRAFMEKFWNEQRLTQIFKDIYEN